jgi:diacylglycerol kinase family enzyme
MYLYLVDQRIHSGKYATTLARIESRLIELGINGKMEKLSVLKSLKELVQDHVREGMKTAVAIGTDAVLRQLIAVAAPLNLIVGFIPLGSPTNLAKVFGIPEAAAACDVLSARMIKKIDMGKVNHHYFFSSLELEHPGVRMTCDGKYQINIRSDRPTISVCNFGNIFHGTFGKEDLSNPCDGYLEAVIRDPQRRSFFGGSSGHNSVFPVKKLTIHAEREAVKLVADHEQVISTPVTVEVLPQKLKIIVGKSRWF